MRQFEGLVAPWHYRSISKCPRAALKIRLLLPKTLTILPPRVPHCRVVINWKLAKVIGTNCLSYVSFEPACKFKLFHRWRSCQDSQKTSRERFQGFWTEEVCQGQTWCFKFSFVCNSYSFSANWFPADREDWFEIAGKQTTRCRSLRFFKNLR